jgi:hypothetical protein
MSNISELQMLMSPCGDPEHLKAWIKRYTGLDFPNQTISRFSNSNPLDFVWRVYRAIMDGDSAGFLAVAGRDSMKTLSLSIIDLLSFLHDCRNTVHIAMTTQQASRARNYLEKFINKELLIRQSITKQNTREIRLNINGEDVGLEVLPATPKAVQGAHCSLLTFDELASSMEPSNIRAYADAHGIVGSSTKGKPGVIVKITSRQKGHSLAEQELRDAAKTGIEVLKWTTLDSTERCPDERSGTIPTPLYVHPLKGTKFTEQEFMGLPAGKTDGFQRTDDTFDKCRECPIAAFCLGDLKKQKSKSVLLRKIDDVINKIRMSGSWDWGVAQIMSMKPSSEGLIYFEFDRQIHVPGWDIMWKVLTGEENPFANRDSFIAELKRRRATFYAGVDWGWSSPSTCVVMAVDRREYCYIIDAVGRTFTPDPEFIELIRTTVHRQYDIQMYCPDLANGSGNALLKQAGLPTTDEIDKSIPLGLNLVKGLLRIPGTNGQSRIFLAPDLQSNIPGIPGIIEEFEIYKKKQDPTGKILDNEPPEEGNDHYLDPLRYMIWWLFGRMRMKVGSDFHTPTTGRTESNIPSLDQIAREHGLQFMDNREPGQVDSDGEGFKPSGPLWSWT